MSVFSSLLTRVREYVGPRVLPTGTSFDDGRERQMSAPKSITRWHLQDLEGAVVQADNGGLRFAGQLWRSMRRDGQIAGVLSTRTQGLVQLPMRLLGDQREVEALAQDFAAVFPTSELALLVADGIGLGIGVAEFVQVDGALPVLRRLDPEKLSYRWAEDRWYYESIHGIEPVNPGDGRWVLHCPGGAVQPWNNGMWAALGRAFIAKEHAFFFRENYSSKLANAARVATSPSGATDVQKLSFFQRVAAWGVNTVFDLPPGWDVKLLESNGRGYEVFQETIRTANEEIVITLAGQSVTTDGGAGFSNSAIHEAIRSDLIQADANALAFTLNQFAIPVWRAERFGGFAANDAFVTTVEWDVTPPSDLTKEATALMQAANAVKAMNELAVAAGKQVDLEDIARRYGAKLVDLPSADTALDSDEVALVEGGPVVADAEEEAPTENAAAALAEKMTQHAVPRCEHGATNRCRLCGIERVRDFAVGADGEHQWQVAWKPIAAPAPVPASEVAA